MKDKKERRYNPPLAHSNLTEHENMRSHYDPNGSWTGTPDGWDKDTDVHDDKHDVESGKDIYEYPLEGIVAPSDGKTYEQNTRNLIKNDLESGKDIYDDRDRMENRASHNNRSTYDGKHDIESSGDIYPLGDEGAPCDEDGYPSVPDGELPIWKSGIKQDVTPVQDADDL